jgi:HEAT repeat protein
VAKTEKDLDLRVTAIRFLGVFGGPARSDVLLEIYRDGGAPRVREAVLGALFVQGNASALVTIARTEKDPALKKQAVSQLALMPSDEAKAYLLEILGQ